ncbi:hypothetical protein STCU_08578 [Strigomonas culicis]|nr:hypothetical protein STCU_08578 [Strigomonas culicis]|eukprot:EPY21369.1 hypothetical protein STCU_08578 [Strigomonas culicis]
MSDSFQFSLTCGATTCSATATLLYTDPNANTTVYRSHNDTIICRGTCDSKAWKSSPLYSSAAYFDSTVSPLGGTGHVTARKDGRSTDDMSFDFTDAGDLLIRAYTTIGNMAARFVTFYPFNASAELLAASVKDGAHVSFDPTCLAKQASTGSAFDVWQWSSLENLEGSINRNTNQYKSGDNYYQTFGGKHSSCDVFREDPCHYAPLLTPTMSSDSTAPSIDWKLYINDCDATWVGVASVESLRALRQPDGTATFQLKDGTHLQGTVYSEVVKPASWTNPSAGYVSLLTPYSLNLTIKDALVLDVETIGSSSIATSPDIQFAVASDKSTNERIYAYSLLLYLYNDVNGTETAVNANGITVTTVTLLNYTVSSPSAVECPECTGTIFTCLGVSDSYVTACGDSGIVQFEKVDDSIIVFNTDATSLGGSNLFPSTTLRNVSYVNHTFFVRVLGTNSANSAGSSPVAEFSLQLDLSNGMSVVATVYQENYISAINTAYLHAEVCLASAYWPVADALGTSLPINQFDGATNAELIASDTNASYGMPKSLTSSCTTAADVLSRVYITSFSSSALSMCAVEDERTYGVTDWVTLSFPSIHDEVENLDDSTLGSNAYTVPELQYLSLSVDTTEAVAFLSSLSASEYPADTDKQVTILLDGKKPPKTVTSEEVRWMSADPSSVNETETVTYYPWAEYASALNYRRIIYNYTDSQGKSASEPYVFAFIPGALLHSSSSVRVLFYVEAAVKFTTYATPQGSSEAVAVSTREEKMYYIIPVSRATASSLRFDADAYTNNITVKSTTGINKTTATSLFIVFAVCIVVVLAGSVYVEVTYKRMIHNAKYHPKRPDSAVGIRYRNGQPVDGPAAESRHGEATPTSKTSVSPTNALAGGSAGAAASTGKKDKGLETKFGLVGIEQTRVVDTGDETPRSKQALDKKTPKVSAVDDDVRSEIRDEQIRVSVDQDETADF